MSVRSFYETVHTLVENNAEYPPWDTLPPEEIRRWTRMARLGGVTLSPHEIEYAWGVQGERTITVEQIANELEKLAVSLRAITDKDF